MTTMTERCTPTQNRVLVRPQEAAETSKGGIILPTSAKEKPNVGTPIACGDGCTPKFREQALNGLYEVMYPKFAGTELVLDETPYVVLREDDVLFFMRKAGDE